VRDVIQFGERVWKLVKAPSSLSSPEAAEGIARLAEWVRLCEEKTFYPIE
jgi:hypothetical protein